MKKIVIYILLAIIAVLTVIVVYLYTLFPGFTFSMGSDYKLGFLVQPRKFITENDCFASVNNEHRERIVSYCNEKGLNINEENVDDMFSAMGCDIENEVLEQMNEEFTLKSNFCAYLFK